MPPRAMRVSVSRAISIARALPVRFQNRRMNSQFIGWGNFGARPMPPSRSSNSEDAFWIRGDEDVVGEKARRAAEAPRSRRSAR